MPNERSELKGAGVANERKPPVTSLPDRRIHRLADLGDWLNRETVLRALEEGDAA